GNPGGRDYPLAEGDAVCPDRGEDLADFFAADRDGIPRPQGAAWDMGAYERPPLAAPTGLRVVGH
ncbi:MAG: choice-of-anchor Q domain-containing protein, partial [Spirochaetota bacterium]